MPTKASDNPYPSILVTEGTEPSAPAAGKQRLYIDSTTHLLKRTDSSGVDVTIEGGGSPWTLLVDEDGSSFANFTSEAGTWSSSAGVIHQTDTGTFKRARYNSKVPQAVTVVKMDMLFPSSGQSGSAGSSGLLMLKDNANTSEAFLFFLKHNGTAVTGVAADRAGVFALRDITFGATKAYDTWISLMVVVGGQGFASFWVDGTFQGNLGYVGGNYSQEADPDYIGLYTYQAKTDFRNLEVFGLTLP